MAEDALSDDSVSLLFGMDNDFMNGTIRIFLFPVKRGLSSSPSSSLSANRSVDQVRGAGRLHPEFQRRL